MTAALLERHTMNIGHTLAIRPRASARAARACEWLLLAISLTMGKAQAAEVVSLPFVPHAYVRKP